MGKDRKRINLRQLRSVGNGANHGANNEGAYPANIAAANPANIAPNNRPHNERGPKAANFLTSHPALTRKIAWQDLIPMSRLGGLRECLLPFPWLAASWALVQFGWWPLALPCTFMFFLTALRVNHEAIHRNLGFGALGHQLAMHGLSILMMGSNHSVAFNHRRHHAHIGTVRDLEGKCGDMSLWQVIRYGPMFPVECHRASLQDGSPAIRRRVRIDLALNLVIPALAILFWSAPLAYHFAAMLVAQCFTALFAVWITHHGCRDSLLVARSQRSKLINFISYNMFFHLEHHLFPAVPVCKLPALAKRLDRAAPEIAARIKPVLGWGAGVALAK